jgi:hypothetical protein
MRKATFLTIFVFLLITTSIAGCLENPFVPEEWSMSETMTITLQPKNEGKYYVIMPIMMYEDHGHIQIYSELIISQGEGSYELGAMKDGTDGIEITHDNGSTLTLNNEMKGKTRNPSKANQFKDFEWTQIREDYQYDYIPVRGVPLDEVMNNSIIEINLKYRASNGDCTRTDEFSGDISINGSAQNLRGECSLRCRKGGG